MLSGVGKATLAKLACVYSGGIFGIYWIPLRQLDESGLDSSWAVALFTAGPALLVLPLLVKRWPAFVYGSRRFHACGMFSGLAYVTYSSAFLYTEVVRVVVMFYLMPIWGFLLARLFLGVRITPVRWVSMLFGFLGLSVICGMENGFPLPQNVGDWIALGAGFTWAIASLLLLKDKGDPVNYGMAFLFWSGAFALAFAFYASHQGFAVFPQAEHVIDNLFWFVPFALIVLLPAAFAVVFGPIHLNPGIVGLLFMTEISVAALSAALLANEPFGGREVAGVILITLAGIAEPLTNLMRRTKNPHEAGI